MILLFDVGNTNIVMGIVEDNKIVNTYRFITNASMTEDEYYSKFQSVIGSSNIDGIAISSVVPLVDNTLVTMSKKYFNITPLIVGPGVKSGVKIKIENPKQLGADLLCDAVGAKIYFKETCVIVDLEKDMIHGIVDYKLDKEVYLSIFLYIEEFFGVV